MRRRVLAGVLGIFACHETTAPPSSSKPAGSVEAPAADVGSPVLRSLAGKLARARAVAAAKPAEDASSVEIGELRGLSRARIREALGEPSTCTVDGWTDSNGARRPVAPCESDEDWFYSFYRLPPGWVGGGPELLLQFDAAGICTRAAWRHTQ